MKKGDRESPILLILFRMINKKYIEELVTEKIKESSFFIVDVSIKPTNKIFVKLDGYDGITIRDCINVSRHIENTLDRDVEDFSLEVSSAGLGTPFKVHQQYQKNINKEIDITDINGKKQTGKLLDINNNQIKVEIEKKEKQKGKKSVIIKEIFEFNIDEVKSITNSMNFFGKKQK